MKDNNHKLFVFSAHYPYGNGETFLEDEMKVLEQLSADITIVSGERGIKETKRFLPKGARVVCSRNRRYEIGPLILAIAQMLLPKTWQEKAFAYKTLGYGKYKNNVNKEIFIYYYISAVLKKTIRKMDIPEGTIFYSYWMTGAAYFLTEFKKRYPDTVCVCRAHGSDCFIEKFYQPFRREILNGLDIILPVSNAGMSSIEQRVIPYVNENHAKLIVERLGVIKTDIKMNPPKERDIFCVVSCSNVIPLKRIDMLIDALEMINNHRIHWIHFGDGEQMNIIQQRADKKLKKDNITYIFTGRVEKKEVLKWYENNHVDVFVNCSDSEGIPVSIMEAFSYGIPAIARDVGGNKELVKSGYNGILLERECTPKLLKDAIISVAEYSQEITRSLRSGAYSTYCNDYCAEKNYKEFYDQLIQMSFLK